MQLSILVFFTVHKNPCSKFIIVSTRYSVRLIFFSTRNSTVIIFLSQIQNFKSWHLRKHSVYPYSGVSHLPSDEQDLLWSPINTNSWLHSNVTLVLGTNRKLLFRPKRGVSKTPHDITTTVLYKVTKCYTPYHPYRCTSCILYIYYIYARGFKIYM